MKLKKRIEELERKSGKSELTTVIANFSDNKMTEEELRKEVEKRKAEGYSKVIILETNFV